MTFPDLGCLSLTLGWKNVSLSQHDVVFAQHNIVFAEKSSHVPYTCNVANTYSRILQWTVVQTCSPFTDSSWLI